MTAESLTYTSLVEDIIRYAERSDAPFVEQIPRLVMMAENRIASEVRGLGYRKVVSFQLRDGDSIYEKPARWRETSSISIVVDWDRKPIFPRTYEYCRTYWPNSSLTETPEFYGDYDYEHFIVVPTPDALYTAEMIYHERPVPLSSDNQTNWTTRYAPQLMLYATLLEAQPFLKRSERIQEFQALYDRAVAAVQKEDIYRKTDSSMRSSK